MTTDSG